MVILPQVLQVLEFVNADNIAKGLSPLNPGSVSVAAGKLMLKRIEALLEGDESFAIETTLATRHYAQLVRRAQALGFKVVLLFFWLQTPAVAIKRVAQRVEEGGHNIPTETVIRRYHAGLRNLFRLFMPVVDDWMLYNNSDVEKILVATGGKNQPTQIFQPETYREIQAYVQ